MTFFGYSQDVITKKTGEDIKSKVIDVGLTEVKYKKFENLNGPTYSVLKSDILMIRYENGTKDIFIEEKTKNDTRESTANTNTQSIKNGNSFNILGIWLFNSEDYKNKVIITIEKAENSYLIKESLSILDYKNQRYNSIAIQNLKDSNNNIVLNKYKVSNTDQFLTLENDSILLFTVAGMPPIKFKRIDDSKIQSLYNEIEASNIVTYQTVSDIEGNNYKTVVIGTQTWFAENLKTTKYNDGFPIPNSSNNDEWKKLKVGAYCNFNNEEKYKPFGLLYNWYAVNSKILCPIGWHVPSSSEWQTLKTYVQNSVGCSNHFNPDNPDNYCYNIDKALASNSSWFTAPEGSGYVGDNLYKNNSTGFSALPVGTRQKDGTFLGLTSYCSWWHSDCNFNALDYTEDIYYDRYRVRTYNKNEGHSVRCIKDN